MKARQLHYWYTDSNGADQPASSYTEACALASTPALIWAIDGFSRKEIRAEELHQEARELRENLERFCKEVGIDADASASDCDGYEEARALESDLLLLRAWEMAIALANGHLDWAQGAQEAYLAQD